jgi:G:T/U-mismatch repair DNA glycosylase
MAEMFGFGSSVVTHRFLDHRIGPTTETLIIGTFNPEAAKNKADFLYSTGRNYLWRILPTAYGEESLQGKTAQAKKAFIRAKCIDFIDLVESIEVNKGQEGTRSDAYIDSKIRLWTDVVSAIDRLPELKRACFTRKTFSKITKIKSRIEAVSEYLKTRSIKFEYVVSPARYYSVDKQSEWTKFLTAD